MSSSEFLIIAAIAIVGLIFLMAVKNYIFGNQEEIKNYGYNAEAESLASFINRFATETSQYFLYSMDVQLSNISISNGILTYEGGGNKYSFSVPKEISNTYLEEATFICLVKQGENITLLDKCPVCNIDSVCTLGECKENCPDCSGPNKICIGDGFCNRNIGENCGSSPDCSCKNGICCLNSPGADENGCSDLTAGGKKEGEECWCSVQCESGLECNPTTSDFKNYVNACCESGKNWNGTDCIVVKKPECKYPCTPGCELPTSFDWRNVDGTNWLNPVRDQAVCGSCWAFSTVGAMEGTYNVEQNSPAANKDLSEQTLVTCFNGAGGCLGGYPDQAMSYVQSSGIANEIRFPYTSLNCVDAMMNCLFSCTCSGSLCANPCSSDVCSDTNSRPWKINNYGYVSGNENIKRALICDGPLSVTSENWQHAIVLVGYNDNTKMWTIRNSWGAGWGNGGYGNIPYTGHQYSDISNYVYYVKGVTGQ